MLLYERYTSKNRTEIASLTYEQGKLVYKIRVSDNEDILGLGSLHCRMSIIFGMVNLDTFRCHSMWLI